MKTGIAKKVRMAGIGLVTGLVVILGTVSASLYLIRVWGDTPSAIPSSVNISGHVFTKENRMTILEIVPDEAYDELGPLIGNDQGTFDWQDIVDGFPKGKGHDSQISNYSSKVLYNYCNFVSTTTANKYKLGFVDKHDHFYGQPWDIRWEDISYDLSNLTPVLCHPDNSRVEDGSVRNYFAYAIFGCNSMEDKMNLVVKKASDITMDDIQAAGLIYINGKSHDSEMIHAYNTRYGKNVSDSMNSSNSNCDLDAKTAFGLYRENILNGKALIFQSEDKNPDSRGGYSNIARISLLLCGIDGDTFITEFASKETSYGYEGMRGSVRFESGTFAIYLNTDDGVKKLDFSSTMFTNSSNGYVPTERNNQSCYPAYNASESNRQYLVSRNAFEYNSDNSMTMDMLTKNLKQSDYDSEGRYLGTTYEDAAKKVGSNPDELTPAEAIRYILGDFVKITIHNLHVLDVEPTGESRYDQNDKDDRIKIFSWFGMTEDDQADLTIDHASVNALDGMNTDLRSEYDLIIIGAYDNNVTKRNTFGKLYHRSGNVEIGDAVLGSNDLNETAYNQIAFYALMGLPVVLDYEIYYGDSDIVADDTYMSSIKMTQLSSILLAYKVEATNIIMTPQSSNSRRLAYLEKPEFDIYPNAQNYDGLHATVSAGDLSHITFSGSVSNCNNYMVKIYADINKDGIFEEDATSDQAELFYYESNSSGPDYDSKGEIKGALHSGHFSKTISFPQNLSGYVGWKVEIINADTGLIHNKRGAFAVIPGNTIRKVKVLQIENDSQPSTIDLKGQAFQECFYAKSGVTGLGISVTTYTKSQFNEIVANNAGILNGYSLLVMGLSDNYTDNNSTIELSQSALDEIGNYIDAGNAVLYTHDCLSYRNGNQVAMNEGELNPFTGKFKNMMGMQTGYSLSDSLIQKLTGESVYKPVDANAVDRGTIAIKELNKGAITSYPYDLAGKSIRIQENHGQYFKLDLDRDSDNGNAVVWYTFSESSGHSDSEYYRYTGQDAQNNYYIYSKGNITYTSAGCSKIDSEGNEAELELFVNTFIRAIQSGKSVPQVCFNDAAMENENLYTLTIRNRLDNDIDSLSVRYTVNDSDLIEGVDRLKQSALFYDANGNGQIDGADRIIGYINSSGKISNTSFGDYQGVINGKTYDCDILSAVEESDMPSEQKEEIKEKLLNNELQIGVIAINNSNATGYATVKIIQRELFLLN